MSENEYKAFYQELIWELTCIAGRVNAAKFTRATDRAWFALKKPKRYWADWILRGFGL